MTKLLLWPSVLPGSVNIGDDTFYVYYNGDGVGTSVMGDDIGGGEGFGIYLGVITGRGFGYGVYHHGDGATGITFGDGHDFGNGYGGGKR